MDMLYEGIETKRRVIENQLDKINEIAEAIIETYKNGKKVVTFGNGGSACEATHLVGELVGRYKNQRRSLSAIALNADSAVISCIANDFGYENVFVRQVESQVNPDDLVIGYTTSGRSKNVTDALMRAKEIGAKTVIMKGIGGDPILDTCNINISVPSEKNAHIQEVHLALTHIICEILDKKILGEENNEQSSIS